MSEDKKQNLQESGLVEWSVFSELIAMDEDEEGFSKSLFQTFVDQVIETFQEINENLQLKNLDKLSSLGHYLKGSAAALGLIKISTQCERIQNYGHKNNFDNFALKDSILLNGDDDEKDESKDEESKSKDESKDNENNESNDNDNKINKNDILKYDSIINRKDLKNLKDDNDDFWIALIEDALEKARFGFNISKTALNEYFDDEL